MQATIEYQTLRFGESIELNDARIDNVLMNHPCTNLGYRITCNGKSLFFTGDHEPFYNLYGPEHPRHAPYNGFMEQRQQEIESAMQGVDALIVDCSYTKLEYPAKRGWGHGTLDSALEMAVRVGAKTLYITHHEPTRSDDDLEAVFADLLARHRPLPPCLEVVLAHEGMEVELGKLPGIR